MKKTIKKKNIKKSLERKNLGRARRIIPLGDDFEETDEIRFITVNEPLEELDSDKELEVNELDKLNISRHARELLEEDELEL